MGDDGAPRVESIEERVRFFVELFVNFTIGWCREGRPTKLVLGIIGGLGIYDA